MKLLPVVFFLLVFEPEKLEIITAAIGIAVGFGTFENVCYLAENGAADFRVLLIRGISAGALHIVCGIAVGHGIAHLFKREWVVITGTIGAVGACIVFHGIYNLLITAENAGWRMIGYLYPSVLILILFFARRLYAKIL